MLEMRSELCGRDDEQPAGPGRHAIARAARNGGLRDR
jgi:hypothetical protein